MALGMAVRCLGNNPVHRLLKDIFLLLCIVTGALSYQVLVPERVSAVLGKNITLGCRVEAGANLTQISWERRLPSGPITLAVFNPEYGTSVSSAYEKRLSFRSPSMHDATIMLEDVGFSDIGVYTCKVATFPLGNTQASTTVSVLVEPKVYVSAGSAALLDGGNETVVATCTAERARPPAEVSWESQLFGRSEVHRQEEPNGTTTTQVRYVWNPNRHSQGKALTCVVRHPALQTDFRIPYQLNVQFAPDIMLVGYDRDWFFGQENAQLQCRASANPPVHHYSWTRLDSRMPEEVAVVNGTLFFSRPLQLNDSGVYRCEVRNDMGTRTRDVRIRIQEPPPTTTLPTTPTPAFTALASTTTPPDRHRAHFTSPTLASLLDSSLGTVVGGAVGGVLFLVLLLVLGGACYRRQRHTFRGDYYTKQYLGPADMQKEPHELQEVYGRGGDPGKGSQDLNPKPSGGMIYPDKDQEEWGGNGTTNRRVPREGGYYPNNHNHQATRPKGLPAHAPTTMNHSTPYLPEDCYENGSEGDYVSHVDGSVISRREWYV